MKSQNCLLVEGKDDTYSVIGIMKPHVGWDDGNRPVLINDFGGATHLLDDSTIPLFLKASDNAVVGVVVDADGDCASRWQRIRQICGKYVTNIPTDLPRDGLVAETDIGKRFGVWVMPDNHSNGMLETFLCQLFPNDHTDVVSYARQVVSDAKQRGATYRDTHVDKAIMHTVLAWLDPPGQPFGIAFAAKLLDAGNPAAQPFVKWFRELYQI